MLTDMVTLLLVSCKIVLPSIAFFVIKWLTGAATISNNLLSSEEHVYKHDQSMRPLPNTSDQIMMRLKS